MARISGNNDKTITRTTCPRDCYDACGIAVVRRSDGAVRVLGDPDHPVSRGALCGKCAIAYNGAFLDKSARLLSPLKRIGAKGDGRFAEIGWDEATGEIADRLKAILATGGPETILHGHYTGTCSLLAGGFPQRFFNRLGAGEIDPDSICNAAGHAALGYLYGTSSLGFDPRSAKEAACILVWGANPSAAAPHMHKYWLKETPAKVIVIDPVRHDTAAAADLHLQPYPGSDAALAFAMLRVMRDQRAQALQYGSGQGSPALREHILQIMALEGIRASVDDVVVTTGSQHALELMTKLFIDPGDVVLAEAPSYVTALVVFKSFQAEISHVAMDEHGLVPEALRERIASLRTQGKRIKFLYTVPTFSNPAGVTLTVFPDGRSLIHGVTDLGRAKSIHARFVGC